MPITNTEKKSTTTTIQIERELMRRLKMEAIQRDMPVSHLLDEIVKEAFKHGKHKSKN